MSTNSNAGDIVKCKSCKNKIPDGSIFCMYCGEKQIREKKKKDEIKVPKPTQLPSGAWRIQLRAEGQSVTEATPELCITKAKAIRAGFVEQQAKSPKLTLYSGIDKYVSEKSAILSPSTLRGYKEIQRNRFKDYQQKDISAVNWQQAVNEEATVCSQKTLHNAWGLVASILRSNGLDVPNVRSPQIPPKEEPWLNYEQIQAFLKEIYGSTSEIAALLALHSLRRSELLAITPSKVDEKGIHVTSAKVLDVDGKLIEKDVNKNQSSTRTIPIMIPRLQELIDQSNKAHDEPYVDVRFNKVYNHINTACRHAGLPEVGVHGLRRSFASLAYHAGWSERVTMKIGGWSDFQTMHKVYIKLDNSDLQDAVDKMKALYSQSQNG